MRTKPVLWIVFITAFILLLISRPAMEYYRRHNYLPPPGHVIPGQTVESQLGPERTLLLPPDKVVEFIAPAPGSTVLDLGAGFGFLTFPLARAVGDAGRIYATDVDPKAIATLVERIRNEGVANVTPALVKSGGVDPFYKKHIFDLVLAADVLPFIDSPEVFFAELGHSLNRDNGRLWIINMRLDSDFTMLEFKDPTKLTKLLRQAGPQAEIAKRLNAPSRQALESATAADASACARLIIGDLNRMLSDPSFWPEIRGRMSGANRAEDNLRRCLVEMLDRKRVFETGATAVAGTDRPILRLLNRVLIADLLGTELWNRAAQLTDLHEDQLEPLLKSLAMSAFEGAPPDLIKAGFVLVREIKSLPYHRVWEMRRR